MPCDHLPFEMQPDPAQEGKMKLKKSHKSPPNSGESDEVSGDEYELN